ncbi:Uncharacterised protein [Klebsiella pneumoniae subsp. ozaenae]|uniref:Uncharacterized protein n=1 Tax=Klebsiella pneumoniae subsp. ozaenae TaxID=574 RepID=A0A378C5B7_KLEPO|nr:Uncharacterised protein [Klebsiella pneumoniae subsp. ozaenae]
MSGQPSAASMPGGFAGEPLLMQVFPDALQLVQRALPAGCFTVGDPGNHLTIGIVIHPEECLARFDGPDEAFRVRCHTKLPYTLGRSTVAHWISFSS